MEELKKCGPMSK